MGRGASADERFVRGVVERHGGAVRAAVRRLERNPQDVEELWADVFALAFARRAALEGLTDAQVRTWLVRAAGFLVANHGRRQATRRRVLRRVGLERARPPSSAEEVEVDPASGHGPASDDASHRITVTLAAMRPGDRQVLVLDALGLDGPAIARQLGVTPGAARKRLMVARRAFRRAFVEPASERRSG